jgi:DNA-binding transcriptional MerR regulator
VQWTLEELADLAARALADADVRVANGRVTGVPDGRLIRWYATIGLVDRPSTGPGRAARYGMRHLWQLVAVKRLQAQGLPLVDIQHRLAGATDETLRQIADLPAVFRRPPTAPKRHEDSLHRAEVRPRFWATRPASESAREPGSNAAQPAQSVPARDTVEIVHGVRLAGLTLLLPGAPTADDVDASTVAARPLLDLLAARGLLEPNPTEGSPS